MNGLKFVVGILACVFLASAYETDVAGDNYIVGGRNANRHQFPWIVSLRNRFNEAICGGFILSDHWVGSAAHCTEARYADPRNVIIASGAHTQTDGNRHQVARIINHPRYNRNFRKFDISILRTVDRIPITPQGSVRPINFPNGPVVPVGATVYLAGWGWTQNPRLAGQGTPAVLQYKVTRIISREDCRQRYGATATMIHPESICTYSADQRSGACNGDFGGPLIDQRGTCIGIATFSMGCARSHPDVYAKLWMAIPFYRQATQNTIPNLPQGPR